MILPPLFRTAGKKNATIIAQIMDMTIPFVKPVTIVMLFSKAYIVVVSLPTEMLIDFSTNGPRSKLMTGIVLIKITTIKKHTGIRDFQPFFKIYPAVMLSILII